MTNPDTTARLATADRDLAQIEELIDTDKSLRINPHIQAALKSATEAFHAAQKAAA